MGDISEDVYNATINKLRGQEAENKALLDEASENLSNQQKFINKVIATTSKLGDLWRNGNFRERQKIQNLVYPDGIFYDKDSEDYRTDSVNPALEILGQLIFPVGRRCLGVECYLCRMKPTQLLRAILPDVLIDNFEVDHFEKTDTRFDIWLDEKKVQMREDKNNTSVIAYGFGEYHTIQDFPIRGRATYLHVRKRKWLDKESGEIFSYDWDVSEFDGTRLNAEFVAFLKEGD